MFFPFLIDFSFTQHCKLYLILTTEGISENLDVFAILFSVLVLWWICTTFVNACKLFFFLTDSFKLYCQISIFCFDWNKCFSCLHRALFLPQFCCFPQLGMYCHLMNRCLSPYYSGAGLRVKESHNDHLDFCVLLSLCFEYSRNFKKCWKIIPRIILSYNCVQNNTMKW